MEAIANNVKDTMTIPDRIDAIVKGKNIPQDIIDAVKNRALQYRSNSLYMSAVDFDSVAFYDYFETIGLIDNEKFKRYRDLMEANIFSVVTFNEAVFMSRPPVFIKRDEEGRPHATDGPAIKFTDGWGIYYVHGIQFPKKLFEKVFIDGCSGRDVLGITNTEQRATAIQEIGYEKIIKDLKNLRVVHEDEWISMSSGESCKYQLVASELPIYLLKVQDHTNGHWYVLGVPNTVHTCREAVAWTFGKKEKDWNDVLVES